MTQLNRERREEVLRQIGRAFNEWNRDVCVEPDLGVRIGISELRALLADSEKLERVERQIIERTADMPAHAFAWEKVEGYGDGHPMWWIHTKEGPALAELDAPDLFPGTPAPSFLHIVDTGDEEGS